MRQGHLQLGLLNVIVGHQGTCKSFHRLCNSLESLFVLRRGIFQLRERTGPIQTRQPLCRPTVSLGQHRQHAEDTEHNKSKDKERNKILNLAYRFRRDSLEQGDISWSWPLAQNWNFVGRFNFSLRDDEVLEQFYGLEYESCCWGIRLVGRRFISTRDGTRDSSIGLQLVLKGMMDIGSAADRLLERGILGYSADLN